MAIDGDWLNARASTFGYVLLDLGLMPATAYGREGEMDVIFQTTLDNESSGLMTILQPEDFCNSGWARCNVQKSVLLVEVKSAFSNADLTRLVSALSAFSYTESGEISRIRELVRTRSIRLHSKRLYRWSATRHSAGETCYINFEVAFRYGRRSHISICHHPETNWVFQDQKSLGVLTGLEYGEFEGGQGKRVSRRSKQEGRKRSCRMGV